MFAIDSLTVVTESFTIACSLIKTFVIVAAENTVGVKGKGDIKEQFDDECEMVMKEKNDMYWHTLQRYCTRQSTKEDKSKRRIEKKLHRKNKRQNELLDKIEQSRLKNYSRNFINLSVTEQNLYTKD